MLIAVLSCVFNLFSVSCPYRCVPSFCCVCSARYLYMHINGLFLDVWSCKLSYIEETILMRDIECDCLIACVWNVAVFK